MEPLVTNRRCLIWLRLCPADESTNRRQKLAHTAFAVLVVTGLICGFASSVAFCWKFVSIDLGRSMFAFAFAVAQFAALYMMLVGMILLRHKIGSIFENLSAIYKDNENADSFRFLARVNNTSEWMWQIFFKIMAITFFIILVAAPLIFILSNWAINRNFNAEKFYRPVPYVLPWNQTSPVGYIGELAFTALAAFGYFCGNGAFLLLFASICMHHLAFCKMFKHSVDKLKQPDDENNRCDAKFLCDLMRFHISVKDWFLHTAGVYSSFNAIQLFVNEAILAISIFYMDFQFKQRNYDVMALTAVSIGISNLLIYCYLGKLATECYAKMSDCVYKRMEWYELPIRLQKYFILMIQNMQQPLYYHGFGVIYLNLETFTNLVKAAISYYMAIKTMATE